MSRVLVTGASGFIGQNTLAPLVERGFEVHAVARSPLPPEQRGVHWHTADLLDDAERAALVTRVGASHLLHLAWVSEPGAFWSAPENASWVAATLRLLEEFSDAGGTRVAAAGTCAEYDWSAAQPLGEDAPLAPATFYGVCKDATRRVAEGLARARGLSLAWGRVFFLYGPGEDPRRLVSGVARSIVAGEQTPTTEGSQRRDFMHVGDVAGAFVALLGSEVEGAVNLASGSAVAVRAIVERIADAAGRPDLLAIGALPQRAEEPDVLEAGIDRLRSEVGFAPTMGLDEGLQSTVAWWRDRHAHGGR